jgi:SecD/SecF fusion protein
MLIKQTYWRIAILLATLGICGFCLYPTWQLYFAPPVSPDQRENLKQRALNLGLDLQGGMYIVLEVNPENLSSDARIDAVDRVREIIANRVDQFGVTEPLIHRQGDWRLVVELPGVQNVERAKALIGKTARLEFKILKSDADRISAIKKMDAYLATTDTAQLPDWMPNKIANTKPVLSDYIVIQGADILVEEQNVSTVRALLERPDVQKRLPSDGQFLWGAKLETMYQKSRVLYFVKSHTEMTGEVLANAHVTTGHEFGNVGQSVVNFTTTSEGVRIFSRITGNHVGERLAIILDDQVYSAPAIRSKIGQGSGIIEGMGNVEEAQDLAIVLRAGTLPADVQIIEDRTVGPSLGNDAIAQGKNAATVGLLLVIIFMVLYYNFAGLIASGALLLNLALILATLTAFHGTLTLPGIAGIVLTIGMAVDANVLIFERIKEELRAGHTVYKAIRNGYTRAFLTIVDANITTAISGIVLYQFGTGPIKGFAITLIIGLISSMFTAIFVTRTLFDILLKNDRLSPQFVGQLTLVKTIGIDFLRHRKSAYALSSLVIIAGLFATISKGGYHLGIDFSGGTLLELHFDHPVFVGDVRQALTSVNIGGKSVDLSNSEIKLFGNPHDILIRVKSDAEHTDIANAVKTTLQSQFASHITNESTFLRRQEAVGPKIGSELKQAAILAMIMSMLLIVLYIWWRFKEISLGIGAVIALVHDVLVTLGAFALTDREISMAIVAALLTIVGYSLNDTIVIYDRIRENREKEPFERLDVRINKSINECLSRTIITSLTTLLTVVALLLLGGAVLHDFAFALFVGIIAGTYSTFFVATPFVLEWTQHTIKPIRRAA